MEELMREAEYGRRLLRMPRKSIIPPFYGILMRQTSTQRVYDAGVKTGAYIVGSKAREVYDKHASMAAEMFNAQEQELETNERQLAGQQAVAEAERKQAKSDRRRHPIKVWRSDEVDPSYFDSISEVVDAQTDVAAKHGLKLDKKKLENMRKSNTSIHKASDREWVEFGVSNEIEPWLVKRRWLNAKTKAGTAENAKQYSEHKKNRKYAGSGEAKSYESIRERIGKPPRGE